MAFAGSTHVPGSTHDDVASATVEASVDSSRGSAPPVEKCVEVMLTFHPSPVAFVSSTVIGSEYLAVWSVPSSVTSTLG
jgi:hypothetical protein